MEKNLGSKRTCPKCKAKFYDLNQSEIKCPVCGHSFDVKASIIKKIKTKPKKDKIIEIDDDTIADKAGAEDPESSAGYNSDEYHTDTNTIKPNDE